MLKRSSIEPLKLEIFQQNSLLFRLWMSYRKIFATMFFFFFPLRFTQKWPKSLMNFNGSSSEVTYKFSDDAPARICRPTRAGGCRETGFRVMCEESGGRIAQIAGYCNTGRELEKTEATNPGIGDNFGVRRGLSVRLLELSGARNESAVERPRKEVGQRRNRCKKRGGGKRRT